MNKLIRIAALSLFAWLALQPNRAAAAGMECLEDSKGLPVLWNAAWGAPTGDQDIEYTVVAVRVRNVVPER